MQAPHGGPNKYSTNDYVTVFSVPAQCEVLMIVLLNFLNLGGVGGSVTPGL